VKFWVALTDSNWYRFLSQKADLDEANFWQPTATRRPVILQPGTPVLFKLHATYGGAIVGGGFFADYIPLPISLAWETFAEKNGATSLGEMIARVGAYRRSPIDATGFDIGCSVLSAPFFFAPNDWIAGPRDWKANIVQGKTYDTDQGAEATMTWDAVQTRLAASKLDNLPIRKDRYGRPIVVRPRLGQGGFRSVITLAYERKCVVTGERTLPALDAAHIKPYGDSGSHEPDNGLLLRKDLHALFDDGYLTVTPSLELRVSRQIRERYENGRDYYALDGRLIRKPLERYPAPRREYLEWHGDMKFLG
jgi:putative restriction endonuclease